MSALPGDKRARHLGEVMAAMLKLGTLAFGGPAVHVAMLRGSTSSSRWRRAA